MSDDKILPFKPRGSGPNGPIHTQSPELDQDNYRLVVYDRKGDQVEYLKRGHLIVTNVNIALLDEKSELKWSIPNNGDLVYLERLDEVESAEVTPDEHQTLPSEI